MLFENYVSSELVANLAILVCTNPQLETPSEIWIPNGRVANWDWWVGTKILELISDLMQILPEEMLGFDDDAKGNEHCLL